MQTKLENISLISVAIYVKYLGVGLLLSTLFFFLKNHAVGFSMALRKNLNDESCLLLAVASLIFCLIYTLTRDSREKLVKVVSSRRVDVAVVFLSGGLLGIYVAPLLSFQLNAPNQSLVDTSIGLFFFSSNCIIATSIVSHFCVRLFYSRSAGAKGKNFSPAMSQEYASFISDKECDDISQDVLNFAEKAEAFSRQVYNHGSSEPLVFGLDAPWGGGKTSFVHFCVGCWKRGYPNEVIVYHFLPLQFQSEDDILRNLIEGLTNVIEQELFSPELSLNTKMLAKQVSPKGKLSLPGVELEFASPSRTIEETISELSRRLLQINRKIIVIIDDLDRLSTDATKVILYGVKSALQLPNISYVICFDTKNLTQTKRDEANSGKVTEFLEKFINIKLNLLFNHHDLEMFLRKQLAISLAKNPDVNPEFVDQAVSGISEILNSNEGVIFIPYLGDLRKLKRLVNTILLLGIDKADFQVTDFNMRDLTILLIIYIEHPHLFRYMYFSEAEGKKGPFSLVNMLDKSYPLGEGEIVTDMAYKPRNSVFYNEVVSQFSESEQLLLNNLFCREIVLPDEDTKNLDEKLYRTKVCFNGPDAELRNLERHLDLIVNQKRPIASSQYRFHANLIETIREGVHASEILSREEFKPENPEETHKIFWRFAANISPSLENEALYSLIDTLIEWLPAYSFVEISEPNIGLRKDGVYFLAKLIDSLGINKIENQFSTKKSIDKELEIAALILGTGKYNERGIVYSLSKPERGFMGLIDLLRFRLGVAADRAYNLFNISNSMILHFDRTASTTGLISEIAITQLREISQITFRIFKERYIDKNLSIVEEIERLGNQELFSQWLPFIERSVNEGKVPSFDVLKKISYAKMSMVVFTLYQIGGRERSNGACCGIYAIEGSALSNEISIIFNKYLFSRVFLRSETNPKGYEFFLRYLLAESHHPSIDNTENTGVNLSEALKVLDRSMLTEFWRENKKAILSEEHHKSNAHIVWAGLTKVEYLRISEVYASLDLLLLRSD